MTGADVSKGCGAGEVRLEEALGSTLLSIINNDYSGYDPYDGINTDLGLVNYNSATRLLSTYINKFSVINLRPLLRVRKSKQVMTMSLAGSAIALWPRGAASGIDVYQELERIWRTLKERSLKAVFGYHCWDAHEFPIQMIGRYTVANTISVVGNQVVGEFLLNYYRRVGDSEVLDYVRDIRELFVEKFFAQTKSGSFFKYKPDHGDEAFTFNASLKAARLIMEASLTLGCRKFDSLLERVFLTVIERQKEDGRWNYSHRFHDGYEKEQVDFHQGFILDDLLFYMGYSQVRGVIEAAYYRGLQFYVERQFTPSGQGIYRYPRKWPVNIQNQAQGIVTFSRAAAGVDRKFLATARRIAEWTIEHMQDPRGHFYFLKYPVVTNKISYIRWSDAGMAYALSIYLSVARQIENRTEQDDVSRSVGCQKEGLYP